MDIGFHTFCFVINPEVPCLLGSSLLLSFEFSTAVLLDWQLFKARKSSLSYDLTFSGKREQTDSFSF